MTSHSELQAARSLNQNPGNKNTEDIMKVIPLVGDTVAVVDDEDYEVLKHFTWYLDSKGYAFRHYTSGGKKFRMKMHRQVLGLKKGDGVDGDHRNGNRTDNRRSNLRVATRAQNAANRLLGSKNTSGFKGVTWNKQSSKWQAGIKVHGKSIHLGLHETREAAHAAYCSAAEEIFGEFANTGFRK